MNLLAAYRHYPVSVARFFTEAFRRQGHSVTTVGPYSGDGGLIPWKGEAKTGYAFPQYADKPAIQYWRRLRDVPAAQVAIDLRQFDAVISFDANFRLTGPHPVPSVLYGTDPHAIDYGEFAGEYDHYFSAQRPNLDFPGQSQGVWVPLGYDPTVHRMDRPLCERDVDICFVGVMEGPSYEPRKEAIRLLSERFSVTAKTGLIYEECTAAYNQAKIAFNLSASWDVPMRFWEAFGYGCCNLTNRLPCLEELGFIEGIHYAAYDSVEELMEKVEWLLRDGNWQAIAEAGRKRAIELGCTYDDRVRQMVAILEKAR